MALEDKSAMEGYLETMMQGTTMKQKAYGTLVSSEVHAETIEQLVSLPWRAVVLQYFEEEMRTLMTSVRDLMTQEGAAVASAKRRNALCFVRFMIEKIRCQQ